MAKLEVGAKAPAFTLKDQNGEKGDYPVCVFLHFQPLP